MSLHNTVEFQDDIEKKIGMCDMSDNEEALGITSATRQVRQQWFSGCIFPLRQLFGLTGNRPQSAPACSFLR